MFSIKWGKEYYIKQYPKIHRPSDKWVQLDVQCNTHTRTYNTYIYIYIYILIFENRRGESFNRQFIRDCISRFEVGVPYDICIIITCIYVSLHLIQPTVRQLYSRGCKSDYNNPELSKILRRLAVDLNMWPIELQDMVNISHIHTQILLKLLFTGWWNCVLFARLAIWYL